DLHSFPTRRSSDLQDYVAAVKRLDSLFEEVGQDEQHPLFGLLDILGILIHAYEEEHVPIPEASGSEVLEYLMEEQGIGHEDLPELGGASAVRAVLARERDLQVGEIRALA